MLLALCEGFDADDLHAELARSRASVKRAIGGLRRKLGTDMTGLAGVAREAGLLQVPHRPAA
ncbi:hypothetical protein [Streptomyces sp. NPDC002403]